MAPIPTVRVLLAGALAIVNLDDFDASTMKPFDAEAEAALVAAGKSLDAKAAAPVVPVTGNSPLPPVLTTGDSTEADKTGGEPGTNKVLPPKPDLDAMVKADLVAFAESIGLTLDPRATKEVLIAAINAAYTPAQG